VWGGKDATGTPLGDGGRYQPVGQLRTPLPSATGDGDGYHVYCNADCDDTNPDIWGLPVAVSGMDATEIPGGMHLSWADQSGADGPGVVYDVYSGILTNASVPGDFSGGACMYEDEPRTRWT